MQDIDITHYIQPVPDTIKAERLSDSLYRALEIDRQQAGGGFFLNLGEDNRRADEVALSLMRRGCQCELSEIEGEIEGQRVRGNFLLLAPLPTAEIVNFCTRTTAQLAIPQLRAAWQPSPPAAKPIERPHLSPATMRKYAGILRRIMNLAEKGGHQVGVLTAKNSLDAAHFLAYARHHRGHVAALEHDGILAHAYVVRREYEEELAGSQPFAGKIISPFNWPPEDGPTR